ncbi:hypothetical protein Zmor_021886 [Zophobas morio]|uniref:Sushi domain-containing protein n=1 Tax=Zophobas morio TaxID=2755281 RepID=A0AA38MBC8_9CUCU|nr:hypothetical protein Zmor_021886 [Zophobas morio]
MIGSIGRMTAGWVFPHEAKLQIRCRELGLYKLLGTASPRCQNGVWSSRLPSCVPTTLLTNFTEDAPPTLLIRIPSGSASVEPGGELAVFPGSTIHLECLFSRRLGSPDWTWTSPLGQYLTVTDEASTAEMFATTFLENYSEETTFHEPPLPTIAEDLSEITFSEKSKYMILIE